MLKPHKIPEDIENIKIVSSWEAFLEQEFTSSVNCIVYDRRFTSEQNESLHAFAKAVSQKEARLIRRESLRQKFDAEAMILEEEYSSHCDIARKLIMQDRDTLAAAGIKLRTIIEQKFTFPEIEDTSHEAHYDVGFGGMGRILINYFGSAVRTSHPDNFRLLRSHKVFEMIDPDLAFSFGCGPVLRMAAKPYREGVHPASPFIHVGTPNELRLIANS